MCLSKLQVCHSIRALSLRQEAVQNSHSPSGQKLYPDAGQRPGGNEEAHSVPARHRGSSGRGDSGSPWIRFARFPSRGQVPAAAAVPAGRECQK